MRRRPLNVTEETIPNLGRYIARARTAPYRRPAPRRPLHQTGGADEDLRDDEQYRPRRPIFRRDHPDAPYRVEDLSEDELFQRHVTVVDSYVQHVDKFGIDGHQTRFVLRDLDRADDPVRVLERVMDRLMGIARQHAEDAGFLVSHIGECQSLLRWFIFLFRRRLQRRGNAERLPRPIPPSGRE